MKIGVLDNKGNKIEDIELDNEVFGQENNPDLLTQYVHIYRTNQRQGTSSTKTRAEVSGGGKKPWRQKGTGRARHGSIRSPIWVKGGIAHGPKPIDYALKMPKKMKKKAMQCALSNKLKDGEIKVIKEIKMSKPSTKDMADLMDKAKLGEKTLIVMEKSDTNVVRSASNLPKLNVMVENSLNVYELIKAKQVLFTKNAILNLQKKYK